MAKKEKVVYKEKVNWKKEAALLPGYLIVLIWIAFTAIFLIWILAPVSQRPERSCPEVFSNLNQEFTGKLHKCMDGK